MTKKSKEQRKDLPYQELEKTLQKLIYSSTVEIQCIITNMVKETAKILLESVKQTDERQNTELT